MRIWDGIRPLTLTTEYCTVEFVLIVVDYVVAATDGIVFAGGRARLQAGQVPRRGSGGPGGRGCAAGIISLSRWRWLDDRTRRLSIPGVQKRIVSPENLRPALATSNPKTANHQNDTKSSHSFRLRALLLKSKWLLRLSKHLCFVL